MVAADLAAAHPIPPHPNGALLEIDVVTVRPFNYSELYTYILELFI